MAAGPDTKPLNQTGPPPSLPLDFPQRSSPSRVRSAAPQTGAPSTAPGRCRANHPDKREGGLWSLAVRRRTIEVQVITAQPETAQSFPVFPAPFDRPPLPGTHVYLSQNSHLGFALSGTDRYLALLSGNLLNALGNFECSCDSAEGFAVVGNNPLSYTDPDGLGFWSEFANAISSIVSSIFGGGGGGGFGNVGGVNSGPWNEQLPIGGLSGGPLNTGGVFGSGNTAPFVFSFADQQESISAWDLPGQWFAGFVDLFLNGKPSGGARMVYAVGADLTGGALIAKGAQCASTALALRGAQFAQKGASSTFSEGGKFAGQTVEGVAQALRSGALKASDVPVQYAVKNGTTFLLNTRSSMALTLGGIGRASWSATDVTAELGANLRLAGQLARNPGAPFSAARLGGGCTVSLGK